MPSFLLRSAPSFDASILHKQMTHEQKTDTELLMLARSGSLSAFAELIKRHEQMVYAMVMRQLKDSASAQDITQETFLKAFKAIGTFRQESQFSTWLVQIALNTCLNYIKLKRSREQTLQKRNYEITQSAYEPSIDEVESEKRKELLREKILKLPEHYRVTIVLCSLEGRSYEETAEILGIPIGTVRSRLNKARLLLRSLLHE